VTTHFTRNAAFLIACCEPATANGGTEVHLYRSIALTTTHFILIIASAVYDVMFSAMSLL
jgi:hypothetical protein